MPFLVCNHLTGKEKAGLIAFKFHFTVCVLWLVLAVSWVALQCVIVAFPGHIHLLFRVILLSSILKIHIVSTVSRALL